MEVSPVDLRSRPRFGIVGLLFVLTFLLGLAVAGWGARRFGWFLPAQPPAAAAQTAVPAPTSTPPAPPAADLATLTAREALLAARLAGLEARVAAMSNASARRLIDRGAPLGPVKDQLRLRFGAIRPRAVAAVVAAARAPVTLEELRLGLDAVAPELQAGPRDEPWRMFRRALGELVVLRRADAPRSLPADRFVRARRLLDTGQVEAALAEARTLPGAARAENWTAAARRYVEARRALDALESAAMAGVQ